MPCLMGQKRDKNAPRKPMKRSGMRRGGRNVPAKARVGSKAGLGSSEAHDAFMATYRGLRDPFSRRTWFLRDEKGEKILTCGHHILPRSVYPEYKMERMNVIPLDAETHTWAEDHPTEFQKELFKVAPEQWEWANERSRKELAK